MRLSATAFSFLFFVGSSSVQYFSAAASSPAAERTGQASTTTSGAFLDKILNSGPAAILFGALGWNTGTAKVQLWDERIPLITDGNYQDLIVNEPLTAKQEKERIWVILITGQAGKQDEMSKFADNVFDSAFDQAQKVGDLPHVRWGRIDYLNVTRITTKWNVWQVPYLVILSDRGQTLRFYRHYHIRWSEELLLEYLKTREYLHNPPWSSIFSPGGDKEYILDFFATWFDKLYNIIVVFPRWLLLLVSGSIGSLVIGLLHRPSKKAQQSPAAKPKMEEKPSPLEPTKGAPVANHAVTEDSKSSGTSTASTSSSKPASRKRPKSPSKLDAKAFALTTDSERESGTSSPPGKRSSARQRKNKKTT